MILVGPAVHLVARVHAGEHDDRVGLLLVDVAGLAPAGRTAGAGGRELVEVVGTEAGDLEVALGTVEVFDRSVAGDRVIRLDGSDHEVFLQQVHSNVFFLEGLRGLWQRTM